MAKIIPAILEKNLNDIEEKLSLIKGVARTVQIDVCDGRFVPSKTWPYSEHGKDKDFENIVAQEVGMPYWEDFDFEYDLMVEKPYEKIADFVSAGATKIIVHFESMEDDELSQIIEAYGKSAEDVTFFNVKLCLAIKSTSDMNRFVKFADKIDFVQVMGIRRVGFQGEPFDEDSIKTIEFLRKTYPQTIISVDGGVSKTTASKFLSAGVNELVIGSAIFNSENQAMKIKEFEAL